MPSDYTAESLLQSQNYNQTSNRSLSGEPLTAENIFSSAQLGRLHPIAQISDQELQYLQLEDDRLNQLEGTKGVLPSRGWGDELCYGTGSTYLTGLAAGGLWGLREGMTRRIYRSTLGSNTASIALDALNQAQKAAAQSVGQEASPSSAATTRNSAPFKLRLNTVLNAMTSRGTFVGNNAGVLALLYNGINCSIDKYRGKHDIYGSMVAGAGTGAIWRSTAGLRPMLIASGLMTAGAAAWTSLKPYII